MKHTIDYYTDRGSHTFCAFIDFSKAFDRVNFWKLFHKLLDDGVTVEIVRLLSFWYSHQEVRVRWQSTLSASFGIQNGTRQGGILSLYLFTRYIRDLLQQIVHCRVGCNIGGYMLNVLAYADDIVLLAPSWKALQFLLDLLDSSAADIDMLCNLRKTVCMVFAPKCRSKVISWQFPKFMVRKQHLEFTTEFKYLGRMINNTQLDDADINREIKNLFYRCNVLTRRFYSSSVSVKRVLFKSFCLCMYDVALWTNFTMKLYKRMKACYVKCLVFLDTVDLIVLQPCYRR